MRQSLVAAAAAAVLLASGASAFGSASTSYRSSFLSQPVALVRPSSSSSCRRASSSSSLALHMMFDQLSAALSDITQSALGGKQRMTEQSIQPALRDVRRALLDADVNVEVADALIAGVQKRSLGTEVIAGVSAEQQFVKAMYDELLDIMGGGDSSQRNDNPDQTAEEAAAQALSGPPVAPLVTGRLGDPAVILLAGLQGAGKTTAAGKLALYLKEREVDYDQVAELSREEREQVSSRLPKRQRQVLLIAADVYRPAAIEQLQILGQRMNVPVYAQSVNDDPVEIVQKGLAKAKEEGFDTVIVDTAGRQVIDADLMQELKRIQQAAVQATSSSANLETLLIVDAMTGQEAASLTAAFDAAVGLTGAILTKMDGDSRGGAAVSVRGVSGQPIKFVGTGETLADLEPFYPDRMASRILGMGDVVSLVEKAAAQVSDDEAAAMTQKMRDATFDFDDFLKQSQLMSNLGSVAGIAQMLPGMGQQLDRSQLRSVEARLKKNKVMIEHMTPEERQNPDLLLKDSKARSRLLRICDDSGMAFEDIQQFMSEFQRMRTMMSRMQKQMGDGSGGGDSEPDEADAMAAMGNRSMRRAAKKKKKAKRGGGGGFGR